MKYRSVIIRFLKGMFAGAATSMAIVTLKQPTVWADFVPLLNALAIAATYGGVTGLILAFEKWANWTDDVTLGNLQ